MNQTYKPKPIDWKEYTGFPNLIVVQAKNTLYPYRISENITAKRVFCNYKEGGLKEFNTIADAKEWVEKVHYPAQIKKYFDIVGEPDGQHD